MCRILAILACSFLLAAPSRGDDLIFPDNRPASSPGGLLIIRKGNQTTVAVGGVLIPRKVKVTTNTPEGPVVTCFVFPSVFHTPFTPPLPESAPAVLQVEIPDKYGLIYIEGGLVRTNGTSRLLESPSLPPGKDYPVWLRAVFAAGDNLLIEDKQVVLRAGQSTPVTFDGSGAIAVPLRRDKTE